MFHSFAAEFLKVSLLNNDVSTCTNVSPGINLLTVIIVIVSVFRLRVFRSSLADCASVVHTSDRL